MCACQMTCHTTCLSPGPEDSWNEQYLKLCACCCAAAAAVILQCLLGLGTSLPSFNLSLLLGLTSRSVDLVCGWTDSCSRRTGDHWDNSRYETSWRVHVLCIDGIFKDLCNQTGELLALAGVRISSMKFLYHWLHCLGQNIAMHQVTQPLRISVYSSVV